MFEMVNAKGAIESDLTTVITRTYIDVSRHCGSAQSTAEITAYTRTARNARTLSESEITVRAMIKCHAQCRDCAILLSDVIQSDMRRRYWLVINQ